MSFKNHNNNYLQIIIKNMMINNFQNKFQKLKNKKILNRYKLRVLLKMLKLTYVVILKMVVRALAQQLRTNKIKKLKMFRKKLMSILKMKFIMKIR